MLDLSKEAAQTRININFQKICEKTSFQPLQFLDTLERKAKELCPDYPWNDKEDHAYTYLFAIIARIK
jgi:hypothetical protein